MDWLIPFLCGMGAAVISAWGVGGGTLLLLVMTLFLGVDQRTAQGINLLFFLPTALSALICHWKNGCLDRPTLKNAASAAVPAALLGAWIATAVDVELLGRPFGAYLLLSGVSLILPQKRKKESGSVSCRISVFTSPERRSAPALHPESGRPARWSGLSRRPHGVSSGLSARRRC